MSDEIPRFRLIKGGRLKFSTDHLLAIDVILREHLQPISRFGWVIDADGAAVSSCGAPVTELTCEVKDVVRLAEHLLERGKVHASAVVVTLPPPDSRPCPLVLVPIDSMGVLVATHAGEMSPQYQASLLAIADQLHPIFDAAHRTG